jgi:hypothetical protein
VATARPVSLFIVEQLLLFLWYNDHMLNLILLAFVSISAFAVAVVCFKATWAQNLCSKCAVWTRSLCFYAQECLMIQRNNFDKNLQVLFILLLVTLMLLSMCLTLKDTTLNTNKCILALRAITSFICCSRFSSREHRRNNPFFDIYNVLALNCMKYSILLLTLFSTVKL